MSKRLKQYEVKFISGLIAGAYESLSVEGNSIIVTDFYHESPDELELFVVATDVERGQIFSGVMRSGGKVLNLPENYSNVEFTARCVDKNCELVNPVLKVFLGSGDYSDDVVVISATQAIAVTNEKAGGVTKPLRVEIEDGGGGGGTGVAVKNPEVGGIVTPLQISNPDPGGIRTALLVNDNAGRSIPKSSFHDKNAGDATRGTFVTVSGSIDIIENVSDFQKEFYNFELAFNSWHANPAPQNVFCRVRSARIISYAYRNLEFVTSAFNEVTEPFDYTIMNAGQGFMAVSPWNNTQVSGIPSFLGFDIPNLSDWSQKTPSTNGLYTIYQNHKKGNVVNYPRAARTYLLEVLGNGQEEIAFLEALSEAPNDTMIFPAGGSVDIDAPVRTQANQNATAYTFRRAVFDYSETPVYLTDGMRFGVGLGFSTVTNRVPQTERIEVEFDLYITDNPNEAI